MARSFNVAGPCKPDIHYLLPPLRRLPVLRRLIDGQNYFVIHAPRQSGKTTALLTLAQQLTAEGRYAAVVLSCEVGAPFSDDITQLEPALLSSWRGQAKVWLPDALQPPDWPAVAAGAGIVAALSAWSRECPRPLVLFLDEIDALWGSGLISVLRQLRSAFPSRPEAFPWSLGLCGMRDVRDYKVAAGGSAHLGTASPFNIAAESLTLRGFTRDEVAELYGQHTEETGQVFEPAAVDRAWFLTQGQPWLVNALARQCVEVLAPGGRTVTAADIEAAKNTLILRQDTHLDSLAERLREDRVRRVMEPLLAGGTLGNVPDDDRRFALDLGLVRQDGGLRVANPIYQEIIPRVLAANTQASLGVLQPTWLRADGTLDPDALLTAFVAFWRQHGEPLMRSTPYHEIAPHLVLMAWLHRLVNGGGPIEREYAIGSGRMDLCVRFGGAVLPIELKVWRPGEPDPRDEGLEQLDTYMAGIDAQKGWLVVFDRREGLPRLATRTSAEPARTPSGRDVVVVRA